MIECTRHKARISESTCIARQRGIERFDKGYRGFYGQGYLYEDCRDCETGLKLYREHKEADMEKEKVCTKCGNSFPRDKDHFDVAPRAKDKLTNECKFCRGTEQKSRCYSPNKGKLDDNSHPAAGSGVPDKPSSSEMLKNLEKMNGNSDKQEPVKEWPKPKDGSNASGYEPVMKTCSKCGNEFESSTENFQVNSYTEDGLDGVCKLCRNKRKTEKRRHSIRLYFDKHPELHQRLLELAEHEERTPEQQIRYVLKRWLGSTEKRVLSERC